MDSARFSPLMMRDPPPPVFYFQDAKSADSFVAEEPILPHPEEYPEEIEKLESHYFALGEVSNVWRCKLKTTGCIVAVKAIRGICSDVHIRHKFEQQLEKLVKRWQELKHPNVMFCFGITMQFGPVPGLIFPMCSEGSIMKFVETHPETNRVDLLFQVASGVNYLHEHDFIHADLRGSNILIGDGGTPQIMDAGLSLVVSRADFTTASPYGPCRWMPPEILDVSDEDREYNMDDSEDYDIAANNARRFNKSTDTYSLGMTMLEVISGKVPFDHRRYDNTVIVDVIHGIRPHRPKALKSDGLWDLLGSCWETLPEHRPHAKCVELWLDLLRWSEEIHNIYSLCQT